MTWILTGLKTFVALFWYYKKTDRYNVNTKQRVNKMLPIKTKFLKQWLNIIGHKSWFIISLYFVIIIIIITFRTASTIRDKTVTTIIIVPITELN